MSDYVDHPDVRRVLELAELGTWEVDIPGELKDAVYYCITNGLAHLQRAYGVGPSTGPPGRLFKDRPMILPVEPSDSNYSKCLNVLLLKDDGDAELSKLRMLDKAQPQQEWSEAKSPTEWQKELRISETTWRRYINDGKLVVDRTISTKKVRLRADTLRAIKGSG